LAADIIIRRVAPVGSLIITQARTIRGFPGGVDFTVQLPGPRRLQIDVEVDGEQHFTKDFHDKRVEAQVEIDRRKDATSLEQGRRRVRLHHNDPFGWAPRLYGAIILAMRYPGAAYNLYTHSYLPDVEDEIVSRPAPAPAPVPAPAPAVRVPGGVTV